jgi:hypothetical protein
VDRVFLFELGSNEFNLKPIVKMTEKLEAKNENSIEYKLQKESIVSEACAISKPRTMMIHSQNTHVTLGAMM